MVDNFEDENTKKRHYFIRSFMWNCRYRIFVEKKRSLYSPIRKLPKICVNY